MQGGGMKVGTGPRQGARAGEAQEVVEGLERRDESGGQSRTQGLMCCGHRGGVKTLSP